MQIFTITVTSMDGLQLQTEVRAANEREARYTERVLAMRALRLTADDLLMLDYEPADLGEDWVRDRREVA